MFKSEHKPLPIFILCECPDDCEKKIDELKEYYQKKIDELKLYIHNLHHGMHFIGQFDEQPILCSRLDFM
jgi:hypothetical protein